MAASLIFAFELESGGKFETEEDGKERKDRFLKTVAVFFVGQINRKWLC